MTRHPVYEALAACVALILGAFISWTSFPGGVPRASPFTLTELTPSTAAAELGLRDTLGVSRSVRQYKGQVIILFFGFTRCAEVCPAELFKLAQTMKLLGRDASGVQVMFVTLDPERDVPELLQRYVTSFDSRFIALTGSRQEIEAAAARYFVAHARVGDGHNYVVDHSTSTYIIDTQGNLRLLAGLETPISVLRQDIELLLRE